MKIVKKKTWFAAVGLALVVSTAGGVALALPEDPAGWYEGGHATVPDSNHVATQLKLYAAGGAVVTSGTTTTPLAAFAASDASPRPGDQFATLFVHLPQTTTAEGAWPGLQVTGTDQFSGPEAVAAPGNLGGLAYVRVTSASYTLADAIAALPQDSTDQEFAGLYELRLRSSSKTGGVSDEYAATYLKVTGTSWAVVGAPTLGGGGGTPTAVNTTVTPTWPAKISYGTATSVPVTVSPASGTPKPTGVVRLVSGTTTLSTATLSATGTATLTVSKTALAPGARTLKVVYPGAAGTFNASDSALKSFTVAKAAPGKPTLTVTKKPTPKKKGGATIKVTTPSGLTTATGAVSVSIVKGSSTKTVIGTVKAGAATIKLPKLKAGKYTLTVTYQGSTYYLTATSKAYKLKVK